MNKKIVTSISAFLILGVFLILNSCNNTAKNPDTSTTLSTSKKEAQKTVYPSEVIPFFNHWNLILGDGSNAGHANNLKESLLKI